MKKFSSIIFALAALSFAVISCQPEEEPFEPGEAEVANCAGVFFPTQDAMGSHTLTPADPTSVDIEVKRTNSSGAINVPFVFDSSEQIFNVGQISFADGSETTYLHVDFAAAAPGSTHKFSVVIDDPQYASKYADGATALDYSFMIVEWVEFYGKEASAGDLGHIYQVCWEEDYDTQMFYYETSFPDIRFCKLVDAWHGNQGKADYEFYWNTSSNRLYLPVQYMAYINSNGAEVWAGDYASFYNWYASLGHDCPSEEYFDWADRFLTNNGLWGPYYDGNGNFYLGDVTFIVSGVPTGSGYQFGADSDADADLYMAPGFTRTDFSLKGIEQDFAQDGVLPIYVYAGVDVEKVDMVIVEGTITATQVANQVAAIEKGTAENVITLTEFEESEYKDVECIAAGAEVTLPATGVYTVIAVSYNDEGAIFDSKSIVVNYVADGDQEANAVDLTCGIGSAVKYIGQGVNTDAALEVWAYGSDIVDAKIAAVKYIDLASDFDGALKAVKEMDSVDADVIEAINNGGYVGIAEKLLPGTEYYFVVWASNGFSEGYFVSDEGCYTTGDPLPIYQKFTYADYADEFEPTSQDAFVGKTFNCYATNLFGSLGLNEYIGKVTITDSEEEDEGPDEDGYMDEYVNISGLSGPYGPKYGFSDEMLFDLYAGCLYKCAKTTTDGIMTTYDMVPSGNCYSGNYLNYFIPVMDGYYAFCATSNNYNAGYDLCGIAFYYDGFYAAYLNYILVDPAKDENGLAPAAAAKLSKHIDFTINQSIAESRPQPRQKVEKSISVSSSIKAADGECPVKTVEVKTKAVSAPAHTSRINFTKELIMAEVSKFVF